jgi:predicted HTH domain antitoxin
VNVDRVDPVLSVPCATPVDGAAGAGVEVEAGDAATLMKPHVDIPEDVYLALKIPRAEIEPELRKELAIALYQRGALGFGKARRLAGMTRWEFHEVLGKRQVLRHYTEEDLAEDIRVARGDQ